MESKPILIRNAHIIDPSQELDETGNLLVENGKIAAAGGRFDAPADADVLDAAGLVAAPGLIDMHVHLRDPGFTQKEDIVSGCAAAAAGGVTSVAAMPNTNPAADSIDVLDYILKKAAPLGVHVYPIAAATKGRKGAEPVDFERLAAHGAAAFSDDGGPVPTAAMMLRAMRGAAAAGKLMISHCEEPSLAGGLVNEGEISHKLGVNGLPAAAEEIHAARELILALDYGLPVHLAHMSTRLSLALIRDFKKRGAKVSCETCPHYFSLDESLLLKRDADYRMNPPLRTKDDVEAVREALKDGTIDVIVTDHAPHTKAEKADFDTAPNGVTGLETSLAAGITFLVKPGILTLSELIAKMSLAPARLLKLNAGALKPGAPADIVLFDPMEEWTVDPGALRSRSSSTPYKGMRLTGRAKITIAGGRLIFGPGCAI